LNLENIANDIQEASEHEVVNGKKLPSLKSLLEFQNDVNIALQKFGDENKDVEVGIVMPMIFQIFLTYPYTWFKDAGAEDKFRQSINDEIDHFVKNIVRRS
jgi:hypothetical protein